MDFNEIVEKTIPGVNGDTAICGGVQKDVYPGVCRIYPKTKDMASKIQQEKLW